MKRTARAVIAAVSLAALAALAVAAPAPAATVTSKQATPGMTTRTIWDQTQVTIRKLPTGVNHHGTIHMELYFKNYAADLDVYLLDQDGDVITETGDSGYWLGWESVDYQVSDIATEPTSTGDTYYVVVVAFNGASDYFLWGYYPQLLDADWSDDPAAARNYYLEVYNYPADGSWASITGPRIGTPYSVTPTSKGTFSARLEWPADLADLVVEPDLAQGLMPAWFRQYVYSRATGTQYVVDDGTWAPDLHEEDALDPDDDWYGLYDTFDTSLWLDTVTWPLKTVYYVPNLYMAYVDPSVGPDGLPKTGRTTMGYQAILTYPENLWLRRVVKYSTSYKVYGTFSLNGERVAGGIPIRIQRKTATRDWATVKTVYTNDLGGWSVTVSPGVKWWLRAKAVGDDATGLSTEYSITKVLKAL